MQKFDIKAFGFALGIVWGGLMFLLGIFDIFYFWGNAWGRVMSMVYLGYRPTVFGCIFAAAWGFIYASLLGFAIAWAYNRLVEENKAETDRRIKDLAQKIWEKKGKPAGSAKDDWNEAERIIRGK